MKPGRSSAGVATLALLLAGAAAAQVAVSPPAPSAVAGSTPSPPAADLEIAVTLAPQSIAVGDPVEATLALDLAGADAALEATFPDWSGGWGEAEVLAASPVEKSSTGSGTRLVQRIRLTSFRPGQTALPQVAVRLGGSPERRALTAANLALEVRSVIAPDDKELTPAPPAPPREQPVPRSFWWALAVGVALAAAAGVIAWRRRLEIDPLAAPQLSPHAELERALALLAAEAPGTAFAHLSRALRRYLGRRLDFRALEGTTTEIQRRLAALRLDPALVQRAVRLLRLSDQIKFAARPAGAAEAAERIAETGELAAAIERHLVPVEIAETAGAVGTPGASGAGGAA